MTERILPVALGLMLILIGTIIPVGMGAAFFGWDTALGWAKAITMLAAAGAGGAVIALGLAMIWDSL